MKCSILLTFLLILITPISHARTQMVSPLRFPNESAIDAQLRYLLTPSSTLRTSDSGPTALDLQTDFSNLNSSSVPSVPQLRTLFEIFARLRDTRSWRWDRMPEFPRRLMWLYPSDGCYLRADAMVGKLAEWGAAPPKNIFIFGELSFSSKFQQMTWWYHVAPVYRFNQDVYVLDPALNYSAPLKLQDWALSLSRSLSDAHFALCQAGAITPDNDCAQTHSSWDSSERDSTLQTYLEAEWEGLSEAIGGSPASLLGDHPPWQ